VTTLIPRRPDSHLPPLRQPGSIAERFQRLLEPTARTLAVIAMSKTETIGSLQEVLQPFAELQAENIELGTWIHDSFSALEKLHEELTQWQSELVRKETELDLREDTLSKRKKADLDAGGPTEKLAQEFDKVRQELAQLEEDNSEQLQELELLERQYEEMEGELQASRERATSLEAMLDAERQRSNSNGEYWKQEFRDLHLSLDKYYAMLSDQLALAAGVTRDTSNVSTQVNPAGQTPARNKSTELRRRAENRRESKSREA
jgi:chromosome segregation ATPase